MFWRKTSCCYLRSNIAKPAELRKPVAQGGTEIISVLCGDTVRVKKWVNIIERLRNTTSPEREMLEVLADYSTNYVNPLFDPYGKSMK